MATSIFRDIPISFIAHPVTGNVNLITDERAVKQAVKNIVLTNFYERPYKPRLGGDILSQLFENADPFTEYSIRKNILMALNNYEPRAKVRDVVVGSNSDSNSLSCTIIFSLENSSDPITLNVLLERIR